MFLPRKNWENVFVLYSAPTSTNNLYLQCLNILMGKGDDYLEALVKGKMVEVEYGESIVEWN